MISVELSKQQRALFSRRTGFLQKVILNSDSTQDQSSSLKTKLKLIKYGVTNAREKSGAYLFLPDGPAVDVDSSLFQWIRVEHVDTKGAAVRLRTRVCTNMTIILHCVEFYPTLDKRRNVKYPLINVWNVVDLRQSHNYELAMHLETSIQNKVSWNFNFWGFMVKRFVTIFQVFSMPTQENIPCKCT
jgi:alpha-mannosidase II